MSRLISEILKAPEPSFSHAIAELEALAGRPAVDIKLAHEMKQLFRQKAKELGLDENDTTVKELYFGLSRRALEDSAKLAEIIGITEKDSPKAAAEKCIAYVNKRLDKRKVWALKSATARKQLKDNPPKKLMKIFSVRSIDSALKRASPSHFYCFAHFSELSSWLAKYVAQATKLTNSDFDYRPITISLLRESKASRLKKAGLQLNRMSFAHLETAYIEVVAADERFDGDVLFIVDSLFNHVRSILKSSAYYKYQGFQLDFFSRIQQIRAYGLGGLEQESYPFSWNTLMHAAAELGVPQLIVSTQDSFASAEDLLAPSLAQLGQFDIWKHPFALYGAHDILISSNLSDMIINAINNTSAEDAYVGHARDILKHELFARYLKHPQVRKKVTLE